VLKRKYSKTQQFHEKECGDMLKKKMSEEKDGQKKRKPVRAGKGVN
jgi:hypothetical protein